MIRHDRRRLLRGLVHGSLAGLPLAQLLVRSAHAQTAAASPARMLFVYIPDGCSPEHWHPSGSTTGFTLPEMTQPLAAHRNDLVFLRGLNMYAGGSTHEGGIRKVLTATNDVSLDVFVGQYYREQSAHASIHLGIASTHENGAGYVSYLGSEQPIVPEDNPLRAFERLFGAPGSPSDPEARRQLSVLDAAQADLGRLQSRLGQTERDKLDRHTESLRALENRILAADPGSGGVCGNPDWNSQGWSVPAGYNSYPAYWNRDDQFDSMARLQMDLAVLALQCGLSRSITLQFSHAVSPTSLPQIGTSQRHHDSSHFDANSAASVQTFVTWKRWYCEQFAYLLQSMKNAPGSQGSLLDETLVLLCSELGHSARHDHRDMPFVLAGRGGGLQPGRFLDYRTANGGDGDTHAKLLVSLGNAAGIPIDRFGYTGHGTGPLSGLFM
ncbi:DUF1552 domain-containing protein [Sinimarinibacterium flocculans]|uniref:Uncharacterized protein DUF1552 n=1 Tax=Sinimarinibacterium flocculans TaxID=985250 RepID=A0A318EGZ8_9GAMM|nr:DUF1552 domain-containing protein [Sinimarinibacterium flocculans]PXV67716.1 uncharacterized protein DUF1552 [Sinimarinibacterium flocculans]